MTKSIDFENMPAGWTAHELGEFLERIANGLTLKQDVVPPGIPVSRIETISDGTINFERVRYIRELDESKKQKFLLQRGDILFSHINSDLHLGKTAIFYSNKPLLHGMNLLLLRTKKEILYPYYLHYLLNYYRKEGKFIEVAQHAVNQSSLNQKKIKSIRIPLAPLEQQKRIVAEIEKQFSRLDEAVANLKRVKANLKRYKAAVLKAAVEGKLTEKWREEHPDAEPASKLLQRILAERRKKWEEAELAKMKAKGNIPKDDKWKDKYKVPEGPEISDRLETPKGWLLATIDQLSVVVRGASPRPAGDPKYFGGEIPWITVGPITADEQPYLRSVPESVTEAGRANSRYIEPETLLLTNSGATLGVPKITLIGGCINDGVVALLDVAYPLKSYLYYYLRLQTERLRRVNQGAAQPNLNTTIIKGITVPFPSLSEQQQIIVEVERRLSCVSEVEAQIDTNLKRAERLQQSVLKKAFSGTLMT